MATVVSKRVRRKVRKKLDRSNDRVRTVEELRAEYERLTRRLMGMSGVEFAEKAKAGELPDTPAADHLLFLLSALTPRKV